jgi:hypothetical protein
MYLPETNILATRAAIWGSVERLYYDPGKKKEQVKRGNGRIHNLLFFAVTCCVHSFKRWWHVSAHPFGAEFGLRSGAARKQINKIEK